MQNYVFIYHVDAPIKPSDEQMAAWGAWFEKLGDKLVDGGNPFNPKAEAQVKNGKVTMDVDTASGYSIVKAENLEEAVNLAMSCPMAGALECGIKVYETMPM
ncbi:MAG: hypothetical protein WCO52_05315 [bacterium]